MTQSANADIVPSKSTAVTNHASPGTNGIATALSWMSQKEYAQKFGKERADHPHIVSPPPGAHIVQSSLSPRQDWWPVMFTGIDNSGRDLPTRTGTIDFGYVHYSDYHNLYSARAVAAAYNNNDPFYVTGYHLEYKSYLVDSSGNVIVQIHAISQGSEMTGDQKYKTPDGRPIGTITAYCEGYNPRCPDIVNQQG
jgi:hypothetical protein